MLFEVFDVWVKTRRKKKHGIVPCKFDQEGLEGL